MSEENKTQLLTRVHRAESEQRRLSVDETLLRREFSESPDLQAEFRMGGVDSFIALKKHEASKEQQAADRTFRQQMKAARREVCCGA